MLIVMSTNDMKLAIENANLLQATAGKNIDIRSNLVYNNGSTGLSEIYNNSVKLFPKEDGYLFVHHDVVMETENWFDKISYLKNLGCQVVGLAGTSDFDISDGRWWVKKGFPSFVDSHGSVKHTDGKKDWITSYGPTPSMNLEMIDGLFMYVGREVFDVGIWFDERFKFHMYDAAFCIRVCKMGFKIGVADVLVKHLSIGEMDSSYEKSRENFIKFYG